MNSNEIDKIFMNSNGIDKILMESSRKQLIEVMYSALSIMQRYNESTVGYCVEEAMKNYDLIPLEKDEIEFGIGTIMPTDATLYVSYKDIHKEFGIEGDSWKIVSFVLNSYRKLHNKQTCDNFVIDTKHYAYPILKHLIDSNTVDDEINNEKD